MFKYSAQFKVSIKFNAENEDAAQRLMDEVYSSLNVPGDDKIRISGVVLTEVDEPVEPSADRLIVSGSRKRKTTMLQQPESDGDERWNYGPRQRTRQS